MLRVLIACECSQSICAEFRSLGDECYSCDLVEQYGGHPEWHIQQDCIPLLHGSCAFKTNDGAEHYIEKWDLVVAHPPCTYLSCTQFQLYNRARLGDSYVDDRIAKRESAIQFFMQFVGLPSPTLIENPVGYLNTHWKRPTQIIQPYQFGDPYTKKTSLWLYGVPKLEPTDVVEPLPPHHFPSSNSMGAWYYETMKLPAKDRARVRSKTFPGIAKAIARQYHDYLSNSHD